MMTITVDGHDFNYVQPGWWASLDDPSNTEGQLVDEDNVIRTAARRKAKAKARHTALTPLMIRAIREACGLTQQEACSGFLAEGPRRSRNMKLARWRPVPR